MAKIIAFTAGLIAGAMLALAVYMLVTNEHVPYSQEDESYA